MLTPQERSALAVWLVMERPMKTSELAKWLELTWHGADQLMCRMSRKIPFVKVDGYWHVLRKENEMFNI